MASREEEGVRSERIIALKKSRAGVVGNMTRTYKEAESIMLHYEKKDEAVKKKEDLDIRFETLRCLNENLLDLLDDPEDRKEAEIYLENHHKEKVEFDEHFQQWIEVAERHKSDQQSGLGDSDSETSRRSRSSAGSKSSKSSHQRLKEAQVKEAVAKLKAIQLKVAHQLEREELELKQRRHSLELQNEIEQATLEAKIWVEDELKREVLGAAHGFSGKSRLNPEASAWIPHAAPVEQPGTYIGSNDETVDKGNILTMILEQQRENK